MDEAALKSRVDELLTRIQSSGQADFVALGNEVYAGAMTVMCAVYGADSNQVSALRRTMEEALALGRDARHQMREVIKAARGSLENLKKELEAGFVGSLRQRIAGDVLTDFLRLSRTALDEPGDGAKNVAAVLAAAAFEDTIRRIGIAFAAQTGTEDLSDVINALKNKGVLQSPQLGIAQGYLNFRNRALHANWEQIERPAVASVLAFVEELLVKHFS
jgi:hypothetical protein